MAAIDADVLVVGAGPAGCALALNLAPYRRVLVLDKGDGLALSATSNAIPTSRVGESLPAAASRLLADMGLWDAFTAQGHVPCQVGRSAWGSGELAVQDAMRNLDGPGWHLDRTRFDAWLRQVAAQRGAAFLAPGRVRGLQAGGIATGAALPGYIVDAQYRGQALQIRAAAVVDATGRNAAVARLLGHPRTAGDKLVCGWLMGRDATPSPGASELHAEAGGWWYTAGLPGQGRVLAFYTDSDLPEARSAHSPGALLARLAGVPALQPLQAHLAACGFEAGEAHGFCAANSAVLAQVVHMPQAVAMAATDDAAAAPWLAVGDAALSFDPLSSQGLFNALYTGLAGAEALHRALDGDTQALPDYGQELARIATAYQDHLEAWYGEEMRWPEAPFWQRRHQAAAARRSGSAAS